MLSLVASAVADGASLWSTAPRPEASDYSTPDMAVPEDDRNRHPPDFAKHHITACVTSRLRKSVEGLQPSAGMVMAAIFACRYSPAFTGVPPPKGTMVVSGSGSQK